MAKATLVELIEAYERAAAACHAWVANAYRPVPDGDTPGEVVYDARERLCNRLILIPGRAAAHHGSVYIHNGGELIVARNVREASEIDRAANEAAGVTVSDDDGEVD